MGKKMIPTLLAVLLTALIAVPAAARVQTVGLFLNTDEAWEGYTLFAPMGYRDTYLIDMEGRLVHSWSSSYNPGLSTYLLENGDLLRTARVGNPTFQAGGAGGRVEEYDWNGSLVWEYDCSSTQVLQHHDVEMLPNGNVLIIAWQMKSYAECVEAGRNPNLLSDNELWPDHIIEVEPAETSGGTIVWE